MNLSQLGQRIKEKYPEYGDLDDEELGKRTLAKYPEYQDLIDEEAPASGPLQRFTSKAVATIAKPPTLKEAAKFLTSPETLHEEARSMGRGFATVGQGFANALKFVGRRVKGDIGLAAETTGRLADDYLDEVQRKWAPPKELQADLADRPELIFEPRWWTNNAPAVAATSLPFILPGAGGAAAALKLARLARLGKGFQSFARIVGGSLTGAASNAVLEGSLAYKSAEERGAKEEEAAKIASDVAGTNFLWTSLTSGVGIFNPVVKNVLARRVISALSEGVQEVGEELISGRRLAKSGLGPEPRPSLSAFVLGSIGGVGGSQAVDSMLEEVTGQARGIMESAGVDPEQARTRANQALVRVIDQIGEDSETPTGIRPLEEGIQESREEDIKLAEKQAKEAQKAALEPQPASREAPGQEKAPEQAPEAVKPPETAPDAKFIGFQKEEGQPDQPLFNITKPGHPRFGSTVSLETLGKEGLNAPEIPTKSEETGSKLVSGPPVEPPIKPPVAEGSGDPGKEQLKSQVFERLKSQYPEMLEGDVSYEKLNLKQGINEAVELIQKNKETAFRVAMGAQEYETPAKANLVNIAMAERALEEGNRELYANLVRRRTLELTKAGQLVVSEKASVSDNSTDRYVRELIKIRMDRIGEKHLAGLSMDVLKKKTKSQRATELIKEETNKVKKRIRSSKEMDIAEAQRLIDSLACV